MPLIPAPGGQTGSNLANSFLSQGLQRRGQGVGLAQMVSSEKRRKIERMLAMFEQFAQQRKQKREAKKAAEKGSGGLGGKIGGGLGAALALALALPTGGLSLATLGLTGLGAGAGATVGGLFDTGPGGAPAVSGPQALGAGANIANIMDKMGLFNVDSQFVDLPSAASGGTTASAGGPLSLAGSFDLNPLAR